MKNVIKLAVIALAVVAISSCSRYSLVNSKVLNNGDLTKYKTFSMQELETKNLPEGVKIDDAQILYYEATKALQARGFSKVESGGDMTVYMSVSMKKSIETNTDTVGVGVGVGYGPGGPGWGGRYNTFGAVPYTHGVYSTSSTTSEVVVDGFLMLDLVDTKTNIHVFSAEISSRLGSRGELINDSEEMAKAMDKLFKKFPIEAPKK